MKILHYTLGLPPARSGGLTRYATDLMTAQSREDDVCLLYPGRSMLLSGTRSIHRNPPFGRVRVFELRNPSLVPLLHGVRRPEDILEDPRKFKAHALQDFYDEIRPDIFHVHTWMGMPLELVRYLRGLGVRLVYTTHDYYGFCAKVNFVDASGTPCPQPSEDACAKCNAKAPAKALVQFRNSSLILRLKNTSAVQNFLRR